MRYLIAICLSLTLVSPIQAVDTWDAIVSYCDGKAVLQRDGQAYRLVRGSGVQFGDGLELSENGQVMVTCFTGMNMTVHGPARLHLIQSQGQNQILVAYGEVRVVHDGSLPLTIVTADAKYALGRSILKLKKSQQQTTGELEAGAACLETREGSLLLERGSAMVSNERGDTAVAGQIGWAIEAGQVRLAAASQTAPQLSLPSATSPQTAAPALPGVGSPKAQGSQARGSQNPAQPLAGNALAPQTTQSPQTAAPADGQQPPPEDEERPRIAQTDAAGSASRGGEGGSANTQGFGLPSFSGSSSLGIGSFSGSSGGFSSGGLFADAGQQTFQGQVTAGNAIFPQGSPFPGSIHLVTSEKQNVFDSVQLNAAEQAKIGANNFYSIGTGAAPLGQVVTDASTGTSPVPVTMSVTRFDAHVVKLDQYGVPDPASGNAGLNSNIGITGLAGPVPTGPAVVGTAPLVDERANFNGNATFALGEFRVSVDANGKPNFSIRRSDQDRLIVKDINGNDANDLVTPNSDVEFEDTVDARFLPNSPTVKTPVVNGALNPRGTTYSELSYLRRSAFTNVVADTLQDYSRRTGQTRFVVDGKIVDISGYQPGK